MRILTVRQPWAWAIIHGGKDVENRPRNIAGNYRGPVAIHAGKSFDYERPTDRFLAEYSRLPVAGRETGYIIGVVNLIEVHEERDCWTAMAGRDGETHEEHCSSWAHGGDVFHLVLENPRPLAEPIPYTGALGLRDLAVRDPQTVLAINRQIGATA
ncbi:hypothetical protein [Microbacterium sp. K24]|uniref:hypothetical protein n=1 Tax=Microbacterium sp. K24 TaxID=2305446 RepID=UPI00197B2723|nr:hypothetical protein [Microbacterium sp. K24]